MKFCVNQVRGPLYDSFIRWSARDTLVADSAGINRHGVQMWVKPRKFRVFDFPSPRFFRRSTFAVDRRIMW